MSVCKHSVLQINVTANWGSTGKIAEQIGLMAMQNGWESHIAYGRMMNASKSHLIKIGNQFDVYMHYVSGRFLDKEGLSSRNSTQSLIREIDKINPSIIHLHNIHDHYLNYPILFRYLAKINKPVVWTQHDQWASTGSCCYTPDDCLKWKELCDKCPLRSRFVFDRSKKNFLLKENLFTSLKTLTLVPVSDWLAGLLKKSFLKDINIQVIRNGIDTDVFRYYDDNTSLLHEIGDRKVILGVAAVWDQRKGLKDFYNLAEMLPSDEYVIVIVGKVVNKNVEIKGNKCRIFFVERTQNVKELARLYSRATVFLNPTYQDNYPTTNLEAMACGTPVITYRTGGSPEAITPETGVVIEQGDISGVAEAINKLNVLSSQEYRLMRRACRKRAEEYFDKDLCFEKYIQLYQDMLH